MTDDLSNNELCFEWIVSFIFCYLGRKTLPVASSSSFRMAWWWRLCRLKPSVTRSCLTQCLIQSTSLVRTCTFVINHSKPQWLHQYSISWEAISSYKYYNSFTEVPAWNNWLKGCSQSVTHDTWKSLVLCSISSGSYPIDIKYIYIF